MLVYILLFSGTINRSKGLYSRSIGYLYTKKALKQIIAKESVFADKNHLEFSTPQLKTEQLLVYRKLCISVFSVHFVQRQRVLFLSRFGLKQGVHFNHFGRKV